MGWTGKKDLKQRDAQVRGWEMEAICPARMAGGWRGVDRIEGSLGGRWMGFGVWEWARGMVKGNFRFLI